MISENEERGERELERRGKARQDLLEHGPAGTKGGAEVAAHQAPEVVEELDRRGAVETEYAAQLGRDLRISRGLGEHRVHDVAGHEAHEHERHEDDAEEDRHGREDTCGDLPLHVSSATCRYVRYWNQRSR